MVVVLVCDLQEIIVDICNLMVKNFSGNQRKQPTKTLRSILPLGNIQNRATKAPSQAI